jgi:hypothetical protein
MERLNYWQFPVSVQIEAEQDPEGFAAVLGYMRELETGYTTDITGGELTFDKSLVVVVISNGYSLAKSRVSAFMIGIFSIDCYIFPLRSERAVILDCLGTLNTF